VIAASLQDGTYPRPQLVRERWESLDGAWEFAYDDEGLGLAERWFAGGGAFPLEITVPFVPESAASGIGDPAFHPVVWYRRRIDVPGGSGQRTILHFGAVDHDASVWIDGALVTSHSGGQTAFAVDITDHLDPAVPEHTLVLRAEDRPDDVEAPRGKQDWELEPHVIWYRRSTGIWRSVWLETVAPQHIESVDWQSDVAAATVTATIELARRPLPGTTIDLALRVGEAELAAVTLRPTAARSRVTVELAALRNAQSREGLLWSPEAPHLVDAVLVVNEAGAVVDEVASYLGIRSTTVGDGAFRLNGVPYFVRSVLEQGWWDESHLTAPTVAHYRAEVEAIRALGFNAARIHQKVEDPRLLYWADRLGLLIWGETAAAYAFSPRAVALLSGEWQQIVGQYRNHPSIVTWVPANESWGVQDVATSRPQREYLQALASLTRAIDPTRPVVSNDGWEHVDSDILTIHDYSADPELLRARYGDAVAVRAALTGHGPQLRRPVLTEHQLELFDAGLAPLMVTEFGGVSYAGDSTWGYEVVASDAEFDSVVGGLFAALLSSPVLAGFCYTQLTDTLQESNGLLRADRTPKLPIERLREIVTGVSERHRMTGLPAEPDRT
jgi:beta-galactosidase/beta-glucuronidase